jgi:hypothetical protein
MSNTYGNFAICFRPYNRLKSSPGTTYKLWLSCAKLRRRYGNLRSCGHLPFKKTLRLSSIYKKKHVIFNLTTYWCHLSFANKFRLSFTFKVIFPVPYTWGCLPFRPKNEVVFHFVKNLISIFKKNQIIFHYWYAALFKPN